MSVHVGLTLPSFVEDPEIPIRVARAAEDAGLDAVFVFDHLWRGDPPDRRPALECFALLGAVAAETTRIRVGTLVARATLRPAATLANAFLTAQRVSNGRLIAAIGSGDSHSRAENEAFGLEFGTMEDRIHALHEAVRIRYHFADQRGLAAERVAAHDLEQALGLCRRHVTQCRVRDALGVVQHGRRHAVELRIGRQRRRDDVLPETEADEGV